MANRDSEVVRPAHSVRYGTIKGTIWKNDTKNGPMYNVTFSRSYRDGDEWKDSSGFGYDDLLLLGKIASECHTWIHETMVRDRAEPDEQPTRQQHSRDRVDPSRR